MGLFTRRGKQPRDKPAGGVFSVTPHRADRYMIGYESIYAAVSRISNTIAAMPMHLMRGYEIQRDHPLERLVSYAPNLHMTHFIFRLTMQANMGNEGNAYALIVPKLDGTPDRLDVLDPARVTLYREDQTGELWYRVSPIGQAVQMWIHNSSMIALQYVSANGERGIRPVDVLKGTLEFDRDMREFSVQQLSNNNNCVALNVPNTGLDEERKTKIITQFLKTYEESGRRVMVLDGGVTATTLSSSPVDAKVLDVARISNNRVATVYNLPPHMLGDYSGTSFTSQEHQTTEYMQMTILPLVAQWEAEFDRKLLTYELVQDGYHFSLDMHAMIRGDIATMAEANQKKIRGGWKTPNEARAEEGKGPKAGGDELLASRDLLPLSMILDGATLTQKEVTTNAD